MKKILFSLLAVAALVLSCTEHVDTSARYVFKEETVISYLEKHADVYSDYIDMLGKVRVSSVSETTLYQLMGARGNFTVFAPTNNGLKKYLAALMEKGLVDDLTWDSFRDSTVLDSIRSVIVYNSIIDGSDELLGNYYYVSAFPQDKGELPMSNMYDRKLVVTYSKTNPDSVFINDAPIDVKNRDILAINGIVHAMDSVIAPSNNTMGNLFANIIDEKREGLYVSALLLRACGLLDSLSQWRDDAYERLYQESKIPDLDVPNGNNPGSVNENYKGWAPEHRYYGFTYFAETDDFWRNTLGKEPFDITPEDVMNYLDQKGVYPDAKVDNKYTSEDNLLNQFVTYHLLPERLPVDRLVYHYNEKGYHPDQNKRTVALSEFYTTMGKRRLLKIIETPEAEGTYLNRFPELDNGRHGRYREVSCAPENEGILVGTPNLEGENNIRNGIVFPIEKLLVYDMATRQNMQKGRIRWDVSAMFPELINNDMRLCGKKDSRHCSYAIPCNGDYKYLNDASIEDGTYFFYWTGMNAAWMNYLGDEFNLQGMTDVTLRLPPVPVRDTYELRFCVQSGGCRGMVQFYWGSDIDRLAVQGIPLDIRICPANNEKILGYEEDRDDDDYNVEIDKRMRNNGFMKSAEVYIAGSPGGTTTGRKSKYCSRRIIVRQTMDPDETYYIRFKTVLDNSTKQFYMDFMEYCPKEVYDNPEAPEDIW